ncbi:MAG: carboxypeptidase regulatory-like domain-containing protein [Myxococcota bacterium]
MKLLKFAPGLLIFSFLFAACGGDESYDETITVNPVNPIGTIGGVVFDGTTDSPLSDVEITAIVGGESFSTVTDESGIFSINEVPATGSAVLLYESEGYIKARQQVQFSESDSDVSYENPTATANPLWLFSANGSFSIKLLDPEGKPVPEVPVTLEMHPSYVILNENDSFVQVGNVIRVANSNNNGLVEFLDLPDKAQTGLDINAQVTVNIPEVDLDDDGIPDLNSTNRTFNYSNYQGTSPVINLSESQTGSLFIEHTNFSYLNNNYKVPGTFEANDTIYVNFNRAIDSENLSIVLLSNEINGSSWPIEATVDGQMISFDLPGDIEPGKKYYLSIFATTPVYGYVFSRTSPLFTTPDAEPAIVSITKDDALDPSSPLTVTFNQYIGTGTSYITSLSDQNGVVYFSWDIDESGTVGDAPGEIGYDTTNMSFNSLEESPEWVTSLYPSGELGFSKKWRFTPQGSVNAGTEVQFKFDMVSNSNYVVITPEGNSVPPLSGNLP